MVINVLPSGKRPPPPSLWDPDTCLLSPSDALSTA